MTEPAPNGPGADGRPIGRWNGGPSTGKSTDGRSILYAYIAITAFVLSIDSIDVLTILHDAAGRGVRIAAWTPIVAEYSSGGASIALAFMAMLAVRAAPPERGRWLRFAAVQLLAATTFSVLHIAGMVGARAAIYTVLGLRYHWALSDTAYEYRKDLPAYALMASIFWVAGRLSLRPAPPPAESPHFTFDIIDGARTRRTPVGEILAVQSAGNYVKFRLADGSTPLMRATLADVERGLGAHGFVRVHRSWIVNAHRLRLLEPSGSGDYWLVLDGGVEAPVSRRYPAALARLKATAPG
jgi:DNA-binding LytR/AlgR family response regulator